MVIEITNICFKILALSDASREYQELARKFTREEIIPRAAELDKTGAYPWEIIKKAHEIGILNLHIPTELGKGNNIFFSQ